MRRTHAIKADVLIYNSELKLVKVVFISLLLVSAQTIKLDGLLISNEGVRREIVYVRVAHMICDGEIEEIRESTSDSHFKVNKVIVREIHAEKIIVQNRILKLGNKLGCANLVLRSPLIEVTNILNRLNRRSKRSRLEIYAQILKYLQFNSLTINEIAFYAGLNYKMAKKHVEFLLANHLIKAMDRDGKTYYRTSSRGEQFIKHFKEINRLLGIQAASHKKRRCF